MTTTTVTNTSFKKYLIVGVGNFGTIFTNHRHNVGRQALQFCYQQWKNKIKFTKTTTEWKNFYQNDTFYYFFQPRCYVNETGIFIKPFYRKWALVPEQLIVLYDDLNLQLGVLKISKNKSGGGHNGIKNIIESLGTKSFWHIRIGIGTKQLITATNRKNFVLTNFTSVEQAKLKQVFATIGTLLEDFIINKKIWTDIMGLYSQKNIVMDDD